ncbi:sigma-70 family RNA polymerase sigma factor [Paenibacillus sp. LHD-117]|uniref:RNA polymerase sigma factor n=1 Tax=Paenibacillus sp. LHD-117 TaxID=3071412 RepID=UPI0027E093D8|nr:sigma-70 family RNA polymerase sigma factor [Paenibacillus sp. LHD-117]MDQ6419540.1 sigma-70 family RNA polymerase sigma factor [Paenibacillus sp. LHD-117]
MQSKMFHLTTASFEVLSPNVQREIYQEFYRYVYPSIIYMVQDHATTEDVIQNAFLKIIRNVPQAESEAHLKGWMKVVVKNEIYNYFRKHKKNRNVIDSDSVYINESPELATDTSALESEIETKLMAEELAACLTELKPEYRALIELRWKQQLSYREMAAELDTTEDKVKYKLYKAREAMKKRFSKRWGD